MKLPMEDQYLLPPENTMENLQTKNNFSKSKLLLGVIVIFNLGLIGFNLIVGSKSALNTQTAQIINEEQETVLGESTQVLPTPPPYEPGKIMVNFYEGTTYGQAKQYMQKLGLSIEGTNDYWKNQGITPYPAMLLSAGNLFQVTVPIDSEEHYISLLEKSDIVRLVTYNFIAEAN